MSQAKRKGMSKLCADQLVEAQPEPPDTLVVHGPRSHPLYNLCRVANLPVNTHFMNGMAASYVGFAHDEQFYTVEHMWPCQSALR